MAIASLVLGILSFIFCPLSILAIIFGAIGMGKPQGKGMAIAGFVLGLVAVVLWIAAFIFLANSSVVYD